MTRKDGRPLVKKEADDKKEEMQPSHIIKDPYVLEFLDLEASTDFYEREMEQALIDKLQEFLLELSTEYDERKHYPIEAGLSIRFQEQ